MAYVDRCLSVFTMKDRKITSYNLHVTSKCGKIVNDTSIKRPKFPYRVAEAALKQVLGKTSPF